MQKLILFLFLPQILFGISLPPHTEEIHTYQITIPGYPKAFNPSIVHWEDGYLLSFRNLPNRQKAWISEIGLVLLDKNFQVISEPQILEIRSDFSTIPCQAEDARLIVNEGKLYVIYNDNENVINPLRHQRRDMYLAEVHEDEGHFFVTKISLLYHPKHYYTETWQKNWSPFFWEGSLFFSYTSNPHEVLVLDEETGECVPCFNTPLFNIPRWNWGPWRGGTPALEFEGEYLSFFHVARFVSSEASPDQPKWHYFMGAYTFSSEPPFQITSYTHRPIIASGFYAKTKREKLVIFPGGFVIEDEQVHIVYGKDDSEVWVATLAIEELKRLLKD